MLRQWALLAAVAVVLGACSAGVPLAPPASDQSFVDETASGGEALRPPSRAARLLAARAIARVTGAPVGVASLGD